MAGAFHSAGKAKVSVSPRADGFAKKLRQQLRAEPPVHYTVQVHPDLSGFASELRTQLASIKASKDVKIHADLDTGQASAKLGVLTRDRKISIRADIDRSADARIASLTNRLQGSRRIKVDADSGGFSKMGSAIRQTQSLLVNFNQHVLALGRYFGAAGQIAAVAMIPMTALAGLSLVPLTASVVQLAGTLSLLPALATAGAAAIGAMAVGFMGIGSAFKEYAASQKATASNAKEQRNALRQHQEALRGVEDAQRNVVDAEEDRARTSRRGAQQIADAERAVQTATRNTTAARKDLTRAYKDAREEIEDLNLAARGTAIDEKSAVLGVARARQRLMELPKDKDATWLDWEEAKLGIQEAEQRLLEVRERNKDIRDDAAEANRLGVQGSQMVVAAKQNVVDAMDDERRANEDLKETHTSVAEANRDAQRRVEDAYRGVEDAQRRVAESAEDLADAMNGGGGVDKFAEAMSKLSPNAKKFVDDMISMKDSWNDLKTEVQDNLWAGMGDDVKALADRQLPVLRTGLAGIATEINGGLRGALKVFSTESASLDFSRTLANSRQAVRNFSGALAPLSRAFIDLSTVGSSFLPQISQGFEDSAHHFSNFISRARESGELESFMQRSIEKTELLGSVTFNLGSIVASTFRATRTMGDGMLKTFDRWTEKWALFLKTGEGQNRIRVFFMDVQDSLGTLTHAFSNIFKILTGSVLPAFQALSPVGHIISGVTDFLVEHEGVLKNLIAMYLAWKTAVLGMKVLGAVFRPVTSAVQGMTGWVRQANAQTASLVNTSRYGAVHMGRFGTSINAIGRYVPVIGNMQSAFVNAAGAANNAAIKTGLAASAMTGMQTVVGGATRIMGGMMSLLGGPAGLITMLASVGIAVFASNMMKNKQSAQEAEASIQELVGTLDEYNGAVTEQTYIQKAKDLSEQGLIDTARNLKIEERDLVAAHLGQVDALKSVDDALRGNIRRSVEASDRWAENSDEYLKAGVTLDDLTAALAGNSAAVDHVNGRISAYNASLTGSGAAEKERLAGLGQFTEQMDQTGQAAVGLADSVVKSNAELDLAQRRARDAASAMRGGDGASRDFAAAMDTLGSSASDADQKVDALKDAIDALNGNRKDRDQALIDQAEAIDAMGEAAARWAEQGAPTFWENGEIQVDNAASREWYDNAQRIADGAIDVALATAEQTKATSKAVTEEQRLAEAQRAAQKVLEDSKQAFIDQQVQLGVSETAARLYADRLFGMPATVSTLIATPNMAGATAAMEILKDKVDLIPGDKKISVDTLSPEDRAALEALEFTIEEIDGIVHITPQTAGAEEILNLWRRDQEARELYIKVRAVSDAEGAWSESAMRAAGLSMTKEEYDAKMGAGSWDDLQAARNGAAPAPAPAPADPKKPGILDRPFGFAGGGYVDLDGDGQAGDGGAALEESAKKFETFSSRVSGAYQKQVKPALDGIRSDAAAVSSSMQADIARDATERWSVLPSSVESSTNEQIKLAYATMRTENGLLNDDFLKMVTQGAAVQFATLPTTVGEGVGEIQTTHFPTLSSGLDTLQRKFGEVVGGIGSKWAELRKAMAEPINWVIRNVINVGLREAWNGVRRFLPMLPDWDVQIPEIQGYKVGGAVRGPGTGTSDEIPAWLSNGEHVWTAAEVQAAGGQDAVAQMRRDVLKHGPNRKEQFYRKGGPVIGRGGLPAFAYGGPVDAWLGSIIDEKFGPTNYVSSALREGHAGYHGMGKAVDVGGPIAPMRGIAQWIAETYPQTAQLIHHPFENNILNGMNVGDGFGSPGYGAQTMSEHADHVHWAADDIMTELSDEEKRGLLQRIRDGLGSLASGAVSSIRNRIADTFEKPLRAIGGKIPNFGDSAWGQLPRNLYDHIVDKAISHVRGQGTSSADAGNTPWDFSAGVEQWRPNVIAALEREGFEPSERNINLTLAQMQTESGGDPNIVQQVQDVNSGGNEGVGLMQVIPGTFASYRNPALPNDRTNPDANLSAALRWYRFKWGDDLGAMWGKGHGYDQGGWLEHGGIGINTSGKPEPVFTASQWEKLSTLISILGEVAPAIAGAAIAQPDINQATTVIGDLAKQLSQFMRSDAPLQLGEGKFVAPPGSLDSLSGYQGPLPVTSSDSSAPADLLSSYQGPITPVTPLDENGFPVPEDPNNYQGYTPETFPYDAPATVDAQMGTLGGNDFAAKAQALAESQAKGWADYLWNYGPSMLTGGVLKEGAFGSSAPEVPQIQINTGPIQTNSWGEAQKVINRAMNRASHAAQIKGGR